MKYSKRYIAFTGVLAVALLIKLNNFGEKTGINQIYSCLSCENGVFLINCGELI